MPFPDKLETFADQQAWAEELARLLPGDDVEHDEAWLKNELTEAHALYTRDRSYARDGLRQALNAVIEYTSENADLPFTEAPALLLSLRRLARALEMLDDGMVDPLLQAMSQGSGAPQLSLDELEFRFEVACVVAAKAHQSGLDDACKRVAEELNRFGFKQQRLRSGNYEEITATTARNWHRDMAKNWEKIRTATKLELDQYLFRGLGEATDTTGTASRGRDFLPDAQLRAIRRRFGHLAI